MDADEYITKELTEEICSLLSSNDALDYNVFSMRWQMYFRGKKLKHGVTYKTYVTCLFRYGKSHGEDKNIDARFVVLGFFGWDCWKIFIYL